MREIKFRAWHPEHGYSKPFHLPLPDAESRAAFAKGETNGGPDWDWIGTIPYWWEVCVIEQNTGLKDKNGKEVYEGDIHGYDGKMFEVKFGDFVDEETVTELYGWHLHSDHYQDSGRLDNLSVEYVNIIGNIHEGETE